MIQFKAESVISETIGAMRVTLAQTETPDGIQELKNSFQLTYSGLTFSSDDGASATLAAPDGTAVPLVLGSWEKSEDGHAVTFSFTDGTALTFDDSDGQLAITARPSDRSLSVTLPFKASGSYSVYERTDSRLVLAEKSSYKALSAPLVADGSLVFPGPESVALFAAYDPAKRFEFSSLPGLPGTELSGYDATIKQLRSTLVNMFTQILGTTQAESLSEAEVTAYVAEMAANGRYGAALDAVPESFKRGNRRTYVSSPYFDNLVSMNRSLSVQTEKYNSQVDQAIASQNLDIFTVDRIVEFILREKKTQRMETLLSLPSSMSAFAPTVSQAAGIITVYCQLASDGEERLASLLEDAIQPCVTAIEDASSYDEESGILVIREGDREIGTVQALQTGSALVALGKAHGRADVQAAGCLLVSQASEELPQLRLPQLAELYPALVENEFYPHTVVLGYYNDRPVWAWTCARSMTYTKTQDGTIEIRMDFPLGDTHYVIISGVPTFHANIEIQGMPFRTDPRFETYNSSGYVYQSDTETLFLKSRHKSQVELVRLGCDQTTAFTYTDGTRP